ncbi:cell wall/vacuolar inhibitor of fructosidase 1-like, partial [Trifolium medium]|nr:cell wall/vacuolar inhibitor of fructosidase 1-like [Trifolium medium]
MFNVMKNKANIALNKIHQLIGKSPPPDPTEPLNSCASKYEAIIANIPAAIEALQNGNPEFAEQAADDTA